MESILAAISTLAILGGITAWVFAWRINNAWAEYTKRLIRETERMNADWADFYRMVCEKEKKRVGNGKESEKLGIKKAAKIIKEHCSAREGYGCGGCELHDEENPDRICRVNAFPVYWKI